jgi:hypothetical protein
VKRKELARLWSARGREGMTIVPLSMYFDDKGRVKLKIGDRQGQEAPRQARDARPSGTGTGRRGGSSSRGGEGSAYSPIEGLAASSTSMRETLGRRSSAPNLTDEWATLILGFGC